MVLELKQKKCRRRELDPKVSPVNNEKEVVSTIPTDLIDWGESVFSSLNTHQSNEEQEHRTGQQPHWAKVHFWKVSKYAVGEHP